MPKPRTLPYPTQERLREQYHYSPLTGEIFDRRDMSKRVGYVEMFRGGPVRRITVEGNKFAAANLIWIMVYGELPKPGLIVLHKNRDGLDDRLANLREGTATQSQLNRVSRKNPRKEPLGLGKTRSGKWTARVSGRHLGTFETREGALAALNEERSKIERREASKVVRAQDGDERDRP